MILTARQSDVLDYLRAFARDNGYPPTVREIGARFGITPNATRGHLKALERKGRIARTPIKSRGIRIIEEVHQE